jgi:hypothetical protein
MLPRLPDYTAHASWYPRSVAEVSTEVASPARRQERRPWTQAWIDAVPIAPAWAGFAFAAGHVLLGALYFVVFVAPRIGAAWPAYQDQSVLLGTSVFALIIGYATASLAYARRGHEATLRDLRPAMGCNDAEFSTLRRDALHFQMPALRRIGLIAAIVAMVGTIFTTDAAQRMSHSALVWNLWQNALFSWLLARTIAHDLTVSGVFSRATERHAEIELFDLTPLMPLAGRGLQSALLIVLAISVFSLLLGTGNPSPLVPVTQAGTVLLAAFALVLPSLGVRRRVRAAKRDEQARLSAELRAIRAQGAATEEPKRREIESRLATLLALKQHVGAAREWPFDLGTLGRFLLYAVIGVGSWLGAATVERLLDLLLG